MIPEQPDLQAENERLGARLDELERRLQDAQEMQDFFRHFAILWLIEHTEADLVDFNPDKCTPLTREMLAEAREFMKS